MASVLPPGLSGPSPLDAGRGLSAGLLVKLSAESARESGGKGDPDLEGGPLGLGTSNQRRTLSDPWAARNRRMLGAVPARLGAARPASYLSMIALRACSPAGVFTT